MGELFVEKVINATEDFLDNNQSVGEVIKLKLSLFYYIIITNYSKL